MVQRAAREISAKYCGTGHRASEVQDDLYHYGIIGLLEAKKRFDRSKNIPFAVFAVMRVRGAMIDHLRKKPVIRLPQLVRRKVKELQQARHELAQSRGDVTDELVAEKLGWSLRKLQEVETTTPSVFSLSEPRQGEGCGENSQGDMNIVSGNPGPEDVLLRRELVLVVQKCLEAMTSHTDRLVLVSRVMHEMKLRELAESIGCSIENIRLRQQKAAADVRLCLERNGWGSESLTELEI